MIIYRLFCIIIQKSVNFVPVPFYDLKKDFNKFFFNFLLLIIYLIEVFFLMNSQLSPLSTLERVRKRV